MNIQVLGRAGLVALCCHAMPAFAAGPLDPDGDHLLGDWGGARADLAARGLILDLTYTGEFAYNLAGGYRRDGLIARADEVALDTRFDLTRLAGLDDAEVRLTVTNRNGEDLTDERLVDPAGGPLSSVQEIHGQGNVTRLTRLWYRQGWRDGALDLKVGRIPVGDDFAVMESHFQNLYLGSSQPGNQAGGVWYNWPISQWAARLRLGDVEGRYVQAGVFDLNPENLDPDRGFSLYRQGTEGALVPVEAGWHRGGDLPGDYKIGAYYSNAETRDYADGGTTGRRYGAWFVVRQQVSAPHRDDRGLVLFTQGSWHDRDSAYVTRYLSAGAVWRGPLPSRPADDLGVGLAFAEVGDPYVATVTAGNAGLGAGAPDYVPPQSDEWNLEVYYGVSVTPWLMVRPNLQLMVHPGANDRVDDAWVLGTRVEATL